MKGATRTKMLVARRREAEYGEERAQLIAAGETGPASNSFRSWLRGRYGATVAERHK